MVSSTQDRPASLDETVPGDTTLPSRSTREAFGRYSIVRVLGAGSGGTVYEAIDPDLDRRVAVKVIPTGPVDGRRAKRLIREAKALARLSHPNIVTVLDVGRDEEHVFITMELIDGLPLDRWLAETSPDIPQILRAFADAAQGLQAAHDEGLIHRDFKPANVMVDADGRVVVMDFGLVVPATEDSSDTATDPPAHEDHRDPERLTATFGLVGTPLYMAPEQYARGEMTPATDQFAWCLALYEALYHKRAFASESIADRSGALMRGELEAPPRHTGVPGSFWPVLRRGLATRSVDRWPSMTALVDQLQNTRARRLRRIGIGVAGLALVAAAAWPSADAPIQPPPDFAPSVASPLLDQIDQLRDQRDELTNDEKARVALVNRAEALARNATKEGDEAAELAALLLQIDLQTHHKDVEETEPLYLRIYDLGMKLEDHQAAARASLVLARHHRRAGSKAEGERWLRYAESAASASEDPVRWQRFRREEALYLLEADETDAAIEILEDGLDALELLGDDTRVVQAEFHHSLGSILLKTNDPAGALPHFKRTRALRAAALGPSHPSALEVMISVSISQIGSGDYDGGRATLVRACHTLQKASTSTSTLVACWSNLGTIEMQAGDDVAAEGYLKRALAAEGPRSGDKTARVAMIRAALALTQSNLGKVDEAIEGFTASIATLEQLHGMNTPRSLHPMRELAEAYLRAGDIESARSVLSRAIDLAATTESETDHRRLRIVLAEASDHDEAIVILENVLAHPEALAANWRARAEIELAHRLRRGPRARELAQSAWSTVACVRPGIAEYDRHRDRLRSWFRARGPSPAVECPDE
jgi:serine/threonine protein kinase